MTQPYISIVVVARNDNYGIGLLDRFQVFLDNQFFLWEKHKLNAELIIVEWNPPNDKPRLKDVLKWPSTLTYGNVRIIQVPRHVHEKLPNSHKQHFFEYLGKNVGARRAQGQFVLCTNNDLLYSSELIALFASKELNENSFYRTDRYELKEGIPTDGTPENQLRECSEHTEYIQNRYGAMFEKKEKKISLRSLKRILTYAKNRIKYFPYPPPYTNAAGDFFLMHKKYWHFLGGYPEIKPFAYPDALCFMALATGLEQVIVKHPIVIFHQAHEREGPETGRPVSDLEKNKKFYTSMLKNRKPWLPNEKNWGLGEEKLPEFKIL